MGTFISADFVRLRIASPAGNIKVEPTPSCGSGSFDRNAVMSTPDVDKICEGKGPGNKEVVTVGACSEATSVLKQLE